MTNMNIKNVTEVTDEEWESFGKSINFHEINGAKKSLFIKVPFKSALSLVGKKSCFIKNGFIFLNKTDHLQTLISEEFRANLEKMLHFT
jgi:DNA primase large subunit